MQKSDIKNWLPLGIFGSRINNTQIFQDTLSLMMFGRLGVLFVVLAVLVVHQIFRQGVFPVSLLSLAYGILAVGFSFNLVQAIFLDRLSPRWSIVYFQVVFDVGAISIWMHLASGDQGVYALLFLVHIFIVALVYYRRLALFAAVLSSVGFGSVLYLSSETSDGVAAWAAYTALFVILGMVGGFLSEELNRATQSLQEKQATIDKLTAFHERLITNIPTGLLAVDDNMSINFINPAGAHILERPSGDIVGRSLEEIESGLLPFFTNIEMEPARGAVDGDAESADRPVSATQDIHHRIFFVGRQGADGSARLQQTVEIQRGGRSRTLRGDVARFEWEPGVGRILGEGNRGRVLLFQDVTKLLALEEQLKQHEKLAAVGQLAAGIAHEIRNPLASMSGSIEMLKATLPDKVIGKEEHKLMEIAIREIDRLNQLVSEFLDFVKPVRTNFGSVPLQELLSELVLSIQNRKDLDGSIQIRERYESPVKAHASSQKLKQVAWNLLLNAFQAMKASGCIEVGCGPAGSNRVKFWVQDEGVGMTEEVLQRLYEPFFTTKDKGTGLGLATAYKIVEAHQGEMRVHSKPGEGTRFEVYLPAATA